MRRLKSWDWLSDHALSIAAVAIFVGGALAFVLTLHPFGLGCTARRPCDNGADPDEAAAIVGAVTAGLTVLALLAANRAINVSQRHFKVEQMPLVTALTPATAEVGSVTVPMDPQPTELPSQAIVFIKEIRPGVMAFSIPYRNVGHGLARIVRVRLRPRNLEPHYVEEAFEREVGGSFCPSQQSGRVWFNVKQADAPWVFDTVSRGQRAVQDQMLQARFDIDLLFEDVLGEQQRTARLLVRPTYGSSWFPDPRYSMYWWYAEAVRHHDGYRDRPLGGISPDDPADQRDAAQTTAAPLTH